MSHELKPCPFCGGNAKLTTWTPTAASVSCIMCGAHFNTYTEAEAIAAWNTRSVTAAAVMGYEAALSERTCEQLEGLCRDMYREGCYYWLLLANDPPYARSAWCDDFRSSMDELGLLEVDDADQS